MLTPCSAVRITRFDDGTPRHDQAAVHRFTTPVTLAYVHRRRLPPLTEAASGHVETLPALAAFTAPGDHPDQTVLAALAENLRHTTATAVETWSHAPAGWYYCLVPNWRATGEADWTANKEPGTRLHAVATVHPATAQYRPATGQHVVEPGSYLFLSTDSEGPPTG